MKRFWLGVFLLVFFLGAGLLSGKAAQGLHDPVKQALEQASQAAETGNWEAAQAVFREANAIWKKHWQLSAALSDHKPMDQIDALFAQTEAYVLNRDPVAFSSFCAQLKSLLEDLVEAQMPTWWNLL